MFRSMSRKLIATALFVSSGIGTPSHAEHGVVPRGAALESGMSMDEVLKSWGAPVEREEREAKREDVWRYANASVVFSNGRVLRWETAQRPGALVAAAEAGPQAQQLRALSPRRDKPIGDKAVSEILTELQGYDSPDSADAEMPALLGKIGAALNRPTQVQPPPAGRPTPINILPPQPDIDLGDDEDDEEE